MINLLNNYIYLTKNNSFCIISIIIVLGAYGIEYMN